MDQQAVKTSIDGGVAVITLNDPATLNAASDRLMAGFSEAAERFARPDSGARCLILTGEGRGFCSGAHLGGGVGMANVGERLRTIHHPLLTLLRNYPVPVITAVNGVAAGIGCSYALMGDIVVAAESAYFMQAFRRVGLSPDGGSSYLLSRLAGKARAMELALLGQRLPAKTALEWGVINRCVPDDQLMATALDLAKNLAEGPKSLAFIRKLIWDGLDSDWDAALEAEAQMQEASAATEDCAEGIAAFVEKRPAVFGGR